MTPITCADVRERLELFALDECEPGEGPAVAAHLAGCPDCRAALADVRQVIDLVAMHAQAPARLRRLHAALPSRARPLPASRPRAWVLPFFRRAAAVAAALLVMLGLTRLGGLVPDAADGSGGGVTLALVSPPGMRDNRPAVQARVGVERVMAKGSKRADPTRHYFLDLGGARPAAFRERLEKEAGTDRLPPPPRLDLDLVLHNRSPHPIEVRLGDPASVLVLQLRGPGAVSVPARDPLGQPFLTPQRVRLEPGKSLVVPLPRLVFGSPGHVRYAYWTEPGAYRLTVSYRAVIGPGPGRPVPVPGTTIRIAVQAD